MPPTRGVFSKLKFLMPDEWRFVFRAIDFRLVFGAPPKHQTRNVKLEQVVITPEGGGTANEVSGYRIDGDISLR